MPRRSKSESGVDYKAIGRRVKNARRKKDLTQEQLSELCNVSNVYLSRIERGSGAVSLDLLEVIGRALDVDIANLVSEPVFYGNDDYKYEDKTLNQIVEKYKRGSDEERELMLKISGVVFD